MNDRKVSSAEDEKKPEFMNVRVDRDHYAKLLILAGLWRADSPERFVEKYIDDTWEQLGEFIPTDLTLQDFREVARSLLELEG